RNRVDLPQPELPSSAKISCRRTAKLTDFTATVSPKILTRLSIRTNSSAAPPYRVSAMSLLSALELRPHGRLHTQHFERLRFDDEQGLGHVSRRIDHGIVRHFGNDILTRGLIR